ncbi:MAG: argininosuccinate lyase [Candidatus Azotimanducaceae bacterium]
MSNNNTENTSAKLWDGRFSEATDAFVESFTASVEFDQVLAPYDIAGSIAHATMLESVGIITDNELGAMKQGLLDILQDIESGEFKWSTQLEDVHMNIESALTRRIGDTGKKLHTGRSRNDQVATDIRLYLRDRLDNLLAKIRQLQHGIINLAENETLTIMPGFTHLQVAQPISFAHHLMAWFEMIERDYQRMLDCRKRVNVLPLGAAALAGTTYPINRQLTAELLGFDSVAENSLDAVSDRDFAIEFCAAGSVLMMHLSRWSEEMILWASPQFAFIDLPDRFCTGSSIMPQKKNPDVPELVRGKSGRVFGSLTTLLTVMKGQPLAYNKDNQEDKEPLFDTVTTLLHCLTAFADLIPAMEPQRDNMRNAALKGFATATDLADYLVKRGLPFRDAHDVVGKLVALGIREGKDLSELDIDQLKAASPLIDNDVYEVLTLEGSLAARDHIGGTAPGQVKSAIERARNRIQ